MGHIVCLTVVSSVQATNSGDGLSCRCLRKIDQSFYLIQCTVCIIKDMLATYSDHKGIQAHTLINNISSANTLKVERLKVQPQEADICIEKQFWICPIYQFTQHLPLEHLVTVYEMLLALVSPAGKLGFWM